MCTLRAARVHVCAVRCRVAHVPHAAVPPDLTEFAVGLAKSGHMGDAESAYKQATEEATGLAPTHPIRLGLALNFSAFLYEVQCKSDGACDLAKQAFDGAIISSISLCLAVSTRRQKVCSSIVSA